LIAFFETDPPKHARNPLIASIAKTAKIENYGTKKPTMDQQFRRFWQSWQFWQWRRVLLFDSGKQVGFGLGRMRRRGGSQMKDLQPPPLAHKRLKAIE
jgi:hypothetical protein